MSNIINAIAKACGRTTLASKKYTDDTVESLKEYSDGRIDNLLNLNPEGITDGELVDIRVGADGNAYDTAGTAVRTQFTNLSDDVDKTNNKLFEEGYYSEDVRFFFRDVDSFVGENISLNSSTTIARKSLDGYDSYTFVANKDFSVCVDASYVNYYAIAIVTNPTLEWLSQSAGGYMMSCDSCVRYRKSEDNLPSESSPLIINEGDLVCITVTAEAVPYLQVFGFDNVIKKSAIQFEESDVIEVEMNDGFFYYYIQAKNDNYLRFKFVHFVDESTNADGWVQREVDLVSNDKESVIFPVVTNGEWEMAIQLADRPDFIGCMNHGSEVSTIANLYFDGVKKKVTNGSTLKCKRIEITQKSTMYDPNDESTIVGYHYRKHVMTADGITIKQKVEWVTDVVCDRSYVAMMPAVRGNDAKSSVQVTDTFFDDKTFVEYDCSTTTLDSSLKGKNDKGNSFNLYGSKSGVFINLECEIKNKLDSSFAFLSDSVNYNKIYVGYNEDGYNVSNGDLWEWESKYRITA